MARNKLFTSISMVLFGAMAMMIPGVVTAEPIQAPEGGQAGAVERGVGKAPGRSKASPGIDVQDGVRPAMKAPGDFKVKVSVFVFSGNSAISSRALSIAASDAVGKELSFAGLMDVADKVTAAYRSSGYMVARAYIPAQEISNGRVEIAVLEGKINRVQTVGAHKTDSAVVGQLTAPLKRGSVLRKENLERSLLLMNDLAGVKANATLRPGSSTGTTNVVLDVKEGPKYDYAMDFSNFGNEYTGLYRFGAMANANNLAGRGDRLSVRGLMSEGHETAFVSVGYTLPVDEYLRLHEWMPVKQGGTKFNIAWSYMDYEVGDQLAALEVEGSGNTLTMGITHPLERSRNRNLVAQLGYDHKNIKQEDFSNPATADDRLRVLRFGLNGDYRDERMGGGVTSYGAAVRVGLPDFLGGLKSQDPHASRLNTGGRFATLSVEGARHQRINEELSFYMKGAMQLASDEMVSSEQFSLGGPNGVRAYEQGVAMGDRGWLLSGEMRWQMPNAVMKGWGINGTQLVAFMDRGESHIIDALPGEETTTDLAAVGIGMNISHSDDFALKMSHAWGMDVGDDTKSEGREDKRFWIQAVKWFD